MPYELVKLGIDYALLRAGYNIALDDALSIGGNLGFESDEYVAACRVVDAFRDDSFRAAVALADAFVKEVLNA